MPEISIQEPDGSGSRFPIGKERLTIGRSRESDIFLADQLLSRHHAEIRQRSNGFWLLDLGSKNGTLLNGEKIKDEQRLRHGDVITLGEHVLTFSATDESEEEPEALGTKIFSARELSDIATKPAMDAEGFARQSRLLSVLKDAATKLRVHWDLPKLFDEILELLFQAVEAERGAILLLEGTPQQPVVKASRSRSGKPITKVSRSIARRALEQQKSLLLPNVLEDAAFKAQDSILSTGIHSAMCAPLWITAQQGEQESVIGLVYLDSLQRRHSFTEEDLRVLTALANVVAVKIENARLLEESIEKRRMEQEMRVAAEIQNNLLPKCAPQVPGYDLAGSNRPCHTVGGDYYDFALEGADLLLAIGDVSGKGTGAALLMTVLRASVRGHWTESSPAEAVGRINRTVCQNIPENKYITFFMARLEPANGTLTYVNAGHNPPLLVRASGDVEVLQVGGMVLGLFEAVSYESGVARLGPGDLLVAFSDGVTETWSAEDEEFGEKRLGEYLVRERTGTAAELQAGLLRTLDAFAGGAKATDDRTLIVLRRNG